MELCRSDTGDGIPPAPVKKKIMKNRDLRVWKIIKRESVFIRNMDWFRRLGIAWRLGRMKCGDLINTHTEPFPSESYIVYDFHICFSWSFNSMNTSRGF